MPRLRFLTLPIAALMLAACASIDSAPALAQAGQSETAKSEPAAKPMKAPAQSRQRKTYAGKSISTVKKGTSHLGNAADAPRPYDKMADARADVDAALAAARADNKMTIVAMGANWCHDSRGLAAQFEKERFQSLFSEYYELVYVDVGKRDRNGDIAEDFGISKLVGTPTVFVVSADGDVLNLETAPTWRNADSRSEDEIFEYFNSFAARPGRN